MSYMIELSKESLKFSGSHFTIFGQNRGERLHGHNYYVTCRLFFESVDPKLGMAMEFGHIKPILKGICENLDEYVLIPQRSTYLDIRGDHKSVAVNFGAKQYSFPKEDVRMLPLVNITSEELAKHFCDEFVKQVNAGWGITEVELGIRETDGQTVFYRRKVG